MPWYRGEVRGTPEGVGSFLVPVGPGGPTPGCQAYGEHFNIRAVLPALLVDIWKLWPSHWWHQLAVSIHSHSRIIETLPGFGFGWSPGLRSLREREEPSSTAMGTDQPAEVTFPIYWSSINLGSVHQHLSYVLPLWAPLGLRSALLGPLFGWAEALRGVTWM